MRCSKAQVLLQGYVDGELPPARARRVRAHVDGCAECTGRLKELSALKTFLAENRPEIDPWLPVMGWATVTVAVLCVAGWLWLGGNRSQPGTFVAAIDGDASEVTYIATPSELYAEADQSRSRATVVWTEGMPWIPLEL